MYVAMRAEDDEAIVAGKYSKTQLRKIAVELCRVVSSNNCVMDDKPVRHPCNDMNCRMIAVAREALKQADRA